ncbi:suppressor of fused domain protein [Chitinimonas sp.]|uniref:suppressor of fused domain protein n=1 Tax=Chitinimonas sp. TaxID=1934313 RepID=UPI002F95A1C9
MGFLSKLLGGNSNAEITPVPQDANWQAVYQQRTRLFEQLFGAMPPKLLGAPSAEGVWPGGGLAYIPTSAGGQPLFVYSTFGLTNPDMPNELERAKASSALFGGKAKLQRKANPPPRTERPGYGYELVVLSRESAAWPLLTLQWLVGEILLADMDILGIVEQRQHILIEEMDAGDGSSVNLVISKARAPLPDHLSLPNGKMQLLVLTAITNEEMAWGERNGLENLMVQLERAGHGQISLRNRASSLSRATAA